jgi:carbamoyltransferase
MIVWGVSAGYHDAGLSVVDVDTKRILFAGHSERYSKKKNDKWLNESIIDHALQYSLPSEVIWYERPWLKTLRHIEAGQSWQSRNPRRYMQSLGINAAVSTVGHHHSHAAAGFGTSSFEDATVVVIDSIGEYDTASIWDARMVDGYAVYKKLWKMRYPRSIGLMYSAFTQRVGKKPNEEEYIMMGMAALGKDHHAEDILTMYNNKFNFHKGCLDWNKTANVVDIAASAQSAFEILVSDIFNRARTIGSSNNLVYMGGCALNCVMNSKIEGWNDIWIMPNPGDAGSSLGAILAKKKIKVPFDSPFLGSKIEGEYPIEPLLNQLMHKKLVGVANGRAEFGPRAFGNRSLLADPRDPQIKNIVNRVKKREPFRPFAPAILAEYAAEYFDGPTSPYMQFTSTCKQPERFPAIVHVDGTSRVQTVSKDDNPGLRGLLERWYAETGCPILLNTSLNIKGHPLVDSVEDAIAFQRKYKIKVF